MPPERYKHLRQLFEEALEQPEAQRGAFLQQACANDEAAQEAVLRLLDADNGSQSFLQGKNEGPHRIGRYRVIGELGRGGMGVALEAYDPVVRRRIALKTIRLDAYIPLREQSRLCNRLLREARTAGSLSHPHIVAIYDSGVDEDLAFIAMEYIDGPTLQDRLAEGRVDRYEVLRILRQASGALDYAHQSGVVHRDIKPSNIMLHEATPGGTTVKITDFGIAKLTDTEQATVTGLAMGTPNYMSPEQMQGQPVDGRSDQFSLAVVAYEMLTGEKPFQGESLAALVHHIVYADRPAAVDAIPDLPPGVDAVLQRGLARRSQDRYATCTEFVRRLEEALAVAPRHVGRLRRWAALGALLLLLAVGAVQGPRRAPPSASAALPGDRPYDPNHTDPPALCRNVPAQVRGLAGVVTMAGGWGHSLAVENDGSVWAWGWDASGQLGDAGSDVGTVNRLTPGRVGVSSLAEVTAVATGCDHSLALTKSDGDAVWAWGKNKFGQLGNGTKVEHRIPIQVPGLVGFGTIACGAWHSMALTGGSVWTWGRNDAGQLGDGSTVDRPTPAAVRDIAGVVAIAGGYEHSLALQGDGSVWAWGGNSNGQLGDGTTTNRRTPVRVRGLSNVAMVVAGNHHSVALKRDGSVWAWGSNSKGELGDGTTTDRPTPVMVKLLSNAVAIAAGAQHSYALKRNGSVWAWGQNYYGALGDGTWTDRHTPVPVSGLSGVVSIAAGGQHALALKKDGSLWAWGWNDYGQLGGDSVRP